MWNVGYGIWINPYSILHILISDLTFLPAKTSGVSHQRELRELRELRKITNHKSKIINKKGAPGGAPFFSVPYQRVI
jgi:hypothetical protein